jgi:hypothetical protein
MMCMEESPSPAIDTSQCGQCGDTWLWSLLLHEENTFSSRTNFFLVGQSVALIAFATFAAREQSVSAVLWILASLGLGAAAIWLIVQARTYHILGHLVDRVDDLLPQYGALRQKDRRRMGPPANWWLGIVLPSMALTSWVMLMIFIGRID